MSLLTNSVCCSPVFTKTVFSSLNRVLTVCSLIFYMHGIHDLRMAGPGGNATARHSCGTYGCCARHVWSVFIPNNFIFELRSAFPRNQCANAKKNLSTKISGFKIVAKLQAKPLPLFQLSRPTLLWRKQTPVRELQSVAKWISFETKENFLLRVIRALHQFALSLFPLCALTLKLFSAVICSCSGETASETSDRRTL